MSPLMENEKKVNHVLHLLLSLITLGFWIPLWFIVCLSVTIENSGIKSRNKKRYDDQVKMANYRHMQIINNQK